ncbi:deoxynucleoside kinase [Priestia aryabhattai]|nr:deoxynucleoside kinase [Priestia aryabhattai]MDT0155607.1 deoxynucleoside kinase [Priestia aryabhattai]
MITVGGMIGLGKSSVSALLGEELGLPVYYESVDDNPVLARFYTASVEEQEKERLPFLLQLYFLGTRFKSIKENIKDKQGVLDRSIFEDVYFAKRNAEYGKLIGENRISDLELQIYLNLFDEMMEETTDYNKAHGTKAPDVMVYLRASFETVMHRIGMRGRDFEQDESLVEYYRFLWEGYDEWVYKHYKASEVITIDMDVIDVVNNEEDARKVVEQVKSYLETKGA